MQQNKDNQTPALEKLFPEAVDFRHRLHWAEPGLEADYPREERIARTSLTDTYNIGAMTCIT
ncbi:hypothetical protein EYF80_003033 [Liparis tanakae]|uniref:Uncharacterized protein n=1 Tax=Liparis tanakae TaxID=230148 RepID=A0A4Z2J9S0_9TELE|nr:hypothetical protein EYF80_003033 [Liparis tanakae]